MKQKREKPIHTARTAVKPHRQVGGVVGRLLVMAAIVAAIIFGVAIFFKVNTVDVQGNSVYSAQEIIDASGIEIGDNLLTLNKAAAAGAIEAELPYVEEVSLVRSLPATIVIRVEESDVVFAVTSSTNTTWLMNSRGKILEEANEEKAAQNPQLTGVMIDQPTVGATATSEQTEKLDAALSLLEALEGSGLLKDIASIDVERDYEIVAWYKDQYEVDFGSADNLPYKVEYLSAILQELSEYQAGVIDLSNAAEKKATFRPAT